ncbi:hypothetical protein FIBSPDRAFT_889001 [Athelia psychrophila]|uniref:Carbamoyl-phosphate synthetase large subunit-like ATP-binding domain-containing protein n=1 Tax=Athelia psychrophila TaxID=1759441 RepID=A0A166MSZ7_9AGAM|nr:hypothetical protein FIBSPDRAFT_889001 [Fibularhizoctonia sp. CBS 109695]
MSYPGEGERDLLPVSVPELSDMIVDFIHAPCNPTILVIHPINATSCHIRPAPIYAYRCSVTAVYWISEALHHAPTLKDHPDTCPKASLLTTARSRFASSGLRRSSDGAQWQSTSLRESKMLHSRTRPSSCTTDLGSRSPSALLISHRADIHAFVEQGQKSGDDQGAGRGTRSISAQQRVEEAFKRFVTLFRYYLVQTAPSTITSNLAQLLPAASTTMAGALRYQGVGAFACLVNSHTGDWVLLEINPRYAGRGAWCLHRAARRARRHTSMRRSAVRVCEVQCVGTDSDSNILEEGEYDVVGAQADECDNEWDGPAQAVGGRFGFARTARREGGDRHLDLSIGVRIADNEARNDISPRPIQSRRRQEEAHPEAHLHRAQHLYPPPLRHAPNRHLPAPLAFPLKQVQPSAGVCAGTFNLAEHSDNYRAELHPAVLAESGIVAKRDTIAMLSVIKMESMWWRRALGVVRRGKSVDVGVVAGEEILLQLAVVALWMRS